MFNVVQAVLEKMKSFSVSTTNTFIALGIIGIEQIFKVAAYKCPCLVDGGKGQALGNRVYGLVFLLVPALVLFVLGFALSPTTWRLLTGIWKREKKKNTRKHEEKHKKGQKNTRKLLCCTLLIIMMRSCVAPISWICIALLDGHYYACAMVKTPYSESCEVVYSRDGALPYSVDYNNFVAKSQMLGWMVTAAAFVIGCLVFTLFRCCSDFTYLQKEYVDLTGTIEREVFREKAKEKIKVKAGKDFDAFWLEIQERKKGDWDDISRIHSVDSGEKVTSYSGLQEWVKQRGTGNKEEETGRPESPGENSPLNAV